MSGRQHHQGRVSHGPIPPGGVMLGDDLTGDEREELNGIATRAQSMQFAVALHQAQGGKVDNAKLVATAVAIHAYVMEGSTPSPTPDQPEPEG